MKSCVSLRCPKTLCARGAAAPGRCTRYSRLPVTLARLGKWHVADVPAVQRPAAA